MPSYIFINTVTAVVSGAASLLRAGNSTDDVEVVMAALDAGGMVGPATDPYLQYGATVAQAMRGRGANEVDISAMMTAVFAGSAYNAAAGAVVGVTGTAPIGTTTSHGVAAVSISPATDGLPGSMSAADKAKLDAMPGPGPTPVFSQAHPLAAGASYAMQPTDGVVLVTAGSTVQLPAAPLSGFEYLIKVAAGVAEAGPVILVPPVGYTVEDPGAGAPYTYFSDLGRGSIKTSGSCNGWIVDSSHCFNLTR